MSAAATTMTVTGTADRFTRSRVRGALSRHTTGSLLIAGCATTWGIVGIIVREVDAPALTIVFARVALAGLFLLVALPLVGRRELLRRPPWPVLVFGVLLAIHWSLYFEAIKQ